MSFRLNSLWTDVDYELLKSYELDTYLIFLFNTNVGWWKMIIFALTNPFAGKYAANQGFHIVKAKRYEIQVDKYNRWQDRMECKSNSF